MKRTTLCRQKSFKLINWVQEHTVETPEGKGLEKSTTFYAGLASEALGFPVTSYNIRGVCKNFGIALGCHNKKRCKHDDDSTEERLHETEGMVRNLGARVLKLESFLAEQWGKDFTAFQLD